jgi:hypothetical protein
LLVFVLEFVNICSFPHESIKSPAVLEPISVNLQVIRIRRPKTLSQGCLGLAFMQYCLQYITQMLLIIYFGSKWHRPESFYATILDFHSQYDYEISSRKL